MGDRARAAAIIGAILLFLASASCLTVFNKWFLNESLLQFKFALMIGGAHQLFCFLYLLAFEHVFLEQLAGPITRNPRYFLILCPIGVLCAADWGASNFSLESVPLSLYEMIKSTTPMFTLILSIVFGLQRPAVMLFGAVALISMGTYFAVVGAQGVSSVLVEGFPLLGATVLLLGSLGSGFKAVVSQYVMQKLRMNTTASGEATAAAADDAASPADINGITVVFYTAPVTSACLFAMGSFVEGPAVAAWFRQADSDMVLWLVLELAASAFIGMFVSISSFMLMKLASGLAYSVVKIAQRVCIFGMALAFFHESIAFYNGCGFFTALVGIGLYNYYEVVHKKLRKRRRISDAETESRSELMDEAVDVVVDADGEAVAVTVEEEDPQQKQVASESTLLVPKLTKKNLELYGATLNHHNHQQYRYALIFGEDYLPRPCGQPIPQGA